MDDPYIKDLEERVEKLSELFQTDSDIYQELSTVITVLKSYDKNIQALEIEIFHLKKSLQDIFKLIKEKNMKENEHITQIQNSGNFY